MDRRPGLSVLFWKVMIFRERRLCRFVPLTAVESAQVQAICIPFARIPWNGWTGKGLAETDICWKINTYLSEIDFDELRAINEDIVAWIQIPGIGVDYPVVHCQLEMSRPVWYMHKIGLLMKEGIWFLKKSIKVIAAAGPVASLIDGNAVLAEIIAGILWHVRKMRCRCAAVSSESVLLLWRRCSF